MADELPVEPATITLREYLRRWRVVLAPTFVVGIVAWVLHSIWHRFDPVVVAMVWLPAGATRAFFDYRRQFQPQRVPAMLTEGSEELARLKRKMGLLGRVRWFTFVPCILLGLVGRLFNGVHPGEACFLIPDVLWPWIALPIFVGCGAIVWSQIIEAQIKQRTPRAAKVVKSTAQPRSGTVIAGKAFQGNRFHSDHWGEPASKASAQLESEL